MRRFVTRLLGMANQACRVVLDEIIDSKSLLFAKVFVTLCGIPSNKQLMIMIKRVISAALVALAAMTANAQNPFVQTWFTSDPAPLVHDGRM